MHLDEGTVLTGGDEKQPRPPRFSSQPKMSFITSKISITVFAIIAVFTTWTAIFPPMSKECTEYRALATIDHGQLSEIKLKQFRTLASHHTLQLFRSIDELLPESNMLRDFGFVEPKTTAPDLPELSAEQSSRCKEAYRKAEEQYEVYVDILGTWPEITSHLSKLYEVSACKGGKAGKDVEPTEKD